MPPTWRRSLGLLSASQALSQSVSVFIMTLSGVAGASLTSVPGLATLPIAAVVLGSVVGLVPFSRWMARHGRRSGFRIGVGFGVAGAGLAVAGLAFQSFWVFASGHVLIGLQQGAFQYLRFAAGEAVPDEHRSRGISLVLAGGVVAAFLGPWLAYFSRTVGLEGVLGLAFVPVLILYLVLTVLFAFVPNLSSSPSSGPGPTNQQPARTWVAIMVQPAYLQSLAGSSLSYALMILLMTATPLAMNHAGHGSADTSWIIQWHVLGMFVPSFFTGSLIDRWGYRPILVLGLAALLVDALAAILFQGMWSFWASLTLLGVGWNFLYIASTSRLTHTYQTNEKEKAQAAHDLAVSILSILATWAAAPLLQLLGWSALHLGMLPILAATALAVLWPSRPRA